MEEKLHFDEIYQIICKELLRNDNPFFLRADGAPLFREPVIGIQQGDHPAFPGLQQTIPCHLTPAEIWKNEFGNQPEQISVLSFATPFDLKTVAENAETDDCPPMSWFDAKIKWGKVAGEVIKSLQKYLDEKGIAYLRPESSSSYKMIKQANGEGHPTWSQRHIAYVCGVGSFGLHGALITPQGCTHRLDSLLIAAEFDQYSPIAESPFADCLYLQKGTCGVCVKRCPTEAINLENNRWIKKCRQQAYGINAPKAEKALGEFTGGCALCNTRVPCSIKSPMQ